jgi:hypothetical protein
VAGAAVSGGPFDPDRGLRNVPGRQARDALARGARDGIDFSRDQRSSHTRRLTRKYDSDNLEVHQLAGRARIGALGVDHTIRSSCTGVIHHLADPTRPGLGVPCDSVLATRTARST